MKSQQIPVIGRAFFIVFYLEVNLRNLQFCLGRLLI